MAKKIHNADLEVIGSINVTDVTNATGDFLTLDGFNEISKRTAAEVLGDIGAAASVHTHAIADLTDYVSNLYEANGTIVGSRTVTMAGNPLTWSMTGGDIQFNSGRVGVGEDVFGAGRLGDNVFQATAIDTTSLNFKDTGQLTATAMFVTPVGGSDGYTFTTKNFVDDVLVWSINGVGSATYGGALREVESTIGLRNDFTGGQFTVLDMFNQDYDAATEVADSSGWVAIHGGGATAKEIGLWRYDTTTYTPIWELSPSNVWTFGTGVDVVFTEDAVVPDEVYGAPWNGSFEVPTKNAVYDKIESIPAGITDHTGLTSIGTNTHAQIDTHIADGTIHFTQGAISIPLSQASDVTITTIAASEILKWSGAAWINNTLAEAGISEAGHTHLLANVTDVTATATELNLLDLSGLTAGWVLSADTATTASWKAPSGGGGTWGSITGTLSAQTDLQSALDLKLDITDNAYLKLDANNDAIEVTSGSYDDSRVTGLYNYQAAMTNSPDGGASLVMHLERGAAGQRSQLAFPHTSQDLHYRVYNSSVWGAWRQVWTDNDFALTDYVAVTGDTMTGNLVIDNGTTQTNLYVHREISAVDYHARVTVDGNGDAIFLANDGTNTSYIIIEPDTGVLSFLPQGGSKNTVWHAGNDGNGSGLDADLVQGLDLSTFSNRWLVMPHISSGGVMEVGRYIDFHRVDASAIDHDLRLDASADSKLRLSGADGTDIHYEAYFSSLDYGRLGANASGGYLILSDDVLTDTIIRGYGDSDFYGGAIDIHTDADADVLLRFSTDRPWSFRQAGTGASTALILKSENTGKQFRIRGGVDDTDKFTFTADSGDLDLAGELTLSGDTGTVYTTQSSVLRVTDASNGWASFGPENTTFCHFKTDRANFYFDKPIQTAGNEIRSYTGDFNLNRAGSTTARLRITSGETISDQDMRIDGFLLKNSTDRAGLLSISHSTAYSWYGIQIDDDDGLKHWSVMGNAAQFGAYDDELNEWIWLYGENSALNLYYNGSVKLATSNTGITVTGTGVATDWDSTSDRRLKTGDREIEPVGRINWLMYEKEGKTELGAIAQEVQEYAPYMVKEDTTEDKMLSMSYRQLQILENMQLRKELDEANARLDRLEGSLNKLIPSMN